MNEFRLNSIMSIISAVGIFDSLYLINEHYTNTGACVGQSKSFLGITVDCGSVITSNYSEFLGLPVAFYGFLYYVTTFLLTYFKINLNELFKAKKINFTTNKLILAIVTTGLIFSLYFVYLQLIIIELICTYCMVSAATTTVLFVLAVVARNF